MPADRLPNFEGAVVNGAAFAITGRIDDSGAQPARALHLGDEITVVARGTVTKVTHSTDGDGLLVRIQTVKLVEAHDLDDADVAILLSEARERTEAAIDNLLGRSKLPFDDETGGIG